MKISEIITDSSYIIKRIGSSKSDYNAAIKFLTEQFGYLLQGSNRTVENELKHCNWHNSFGIYTVEDNICHGAMTFDDKTVYNYLKTFPDNKLIDYFNDNNIKLLKNCCGEALAISPEVPSNIKLRLMLTIKRNMSEYDYFWGLAMEGLDSVERFWHKHAKIIGRNSIDPDKSTLFIVPLSSKSLIIINKQIVNTK